MRHGILLAFGLLLCGCGDKPAGGIKRYPIQGQVVLADGRPLPGGMISFDSDMPDRSVDVLITANGKFTGLVPAGEYRVFLVASTFDQPEDPVLRKLIPSGYRDPHDPLLTATVKPAGKNEFEFRLR